MIARRLLAPPRPADKRPAAPTPALQREQGAWLLASATAAVAPQAGWLPSWITALGLGLLAWRGALLWQGKRPPPALLLLALALAAGAAVRAEFGHFFGKDPGVAVLLLLLGLKLLETRAARDIRAGVLLCLFLQLALFLEDQSLPTAALALGGTLLALAALVALADPSGGGREHLRSAATLLAQGIPFMLVLFVLFPRLQGPLWGLPADAFSARSGLSDTMSPGSISELGLSGEIALRAAFEGPPPPPARRYWRGPVLTRFDGREWRAAPATEADTPYYTPAGPRLDYLLTLEPHNRRWLLALEHPGPAQPAVRYSSDLRALAVRPLQARSRFAISAYPATPVGIDEAATVLAAATHLPARSNPRSVRLAAELAAGARDHGEILARVIAHLRALRLIYTLRPPRLGADPADEFLFDTRRGFCEHFASAFAVLMRAAGVPTRIVTGYQGGEINPIDGYLVIRQSDAHAWAEVWLQGRGWVRVDPTALAAPQRIEDGLASALADSTELPLMLRPDMAWLRGLRHRWEAVSNAWNQHVLGYNPERQRELLKRLGLGSGGLAASVAALAATALVLFGGLYAWSVRRQRPRDPLQRMWSAFCTRMANAGVARAPWQGPLDYAELLEKRFPAQAQALREICQTYACLRYGPHAPDDDVRALKKRIARLRLE
jgi:transglutaminase-like putative cysteine protease